MLAIGMVYLIDVMTYGRRWMRGRLRVGGSSTAQFDFYEDRIFIKTERSESNHQLPGFIDVTPADRGVFLYPQRDLYFSIPRDSIEPADAIPKVPASCSLRKERLRAEGLEILADSQVF